MAFAIASLLRFLTPSGLQNNGVFVGRLDARTGEEGGGRRRRRRRERE